MYCPFYIIFVILFLAEVQQLTIRQLNDMVDELTTEIDVRSSLLVKELASRDDIIYERELKNTFIALCHKVSRLLSLQHRKNLPLIQCSSFTLLSWYISNELIQHGVRHP